VAAGIETVGGGREPATDRMEARMSITCAQRGPIPPASARRFIAPAATGAGALSGERLLERA